MNRPRATATVLPRPGSADPDLVSARRASRGITVQITLASCAVVCAIVAFGVIAMFTQSDPTEVVENAARAGRKAYIGVAEAVWSLIVIGAGVIILAAVMSWFISRNAVRPLGHALRLQRSFVADASHELRAPLAVLDARLQLLQRRVEHQHEPVGAADIADLRQDTRRLIDLVNDMLATATGIDDHAGAVVDDASAEAGRAIEDLALVSRRRQVTVRLTGDAGLQIAMGPIAFRRCVVSVIDNAIKHSPDGGAVEVAVTGRGDSVEVVVTDHGTGLHGIAPDRIFERFARGRTRNDADEGQRHGFGLGLALTRDVLARHGGTIRVVTSDQTGTTMALRMPRLPGRAG